MVLVLLAACTEAGVQSYNTAPTVSIVSPLDGDAVEPGALVEFYGVARDSQEPSTKLQISWTSSIDGVFDTTAADADGDLLVATNSLSPGAHVITLTAVDSRGDSGTQSISLQVGDVTNVQGAPTVIIVNPDPGEQIGASTPVTLLATVADDLDAPESLIIEIVDDPDGVVWTGYPSATGTIEAQFAAHTLGLHDLVVNALDSEGKTGSASTTYETIQDNVPLVNIKAPNDGDWYDTVDTITFRGTVTDDTTANEQIYVQWTSDLQGVLSAAPPDSNGDTTFASALMGGTHVVTLTATDLEGNVGRDSLVVNVDDPLARDDDGDGYTEYAGDCDDTDDTLSPGETDICDDIDQDCDGWLNDPYWDSYEPNDSMGGRYDLGDVDGGGLWAGDSLEIAGLTFSAASDDDWFYWEADDELWDNVDVKVVVSNLNVAGDYVVELYDDGGNLLDSDSGDGSISAEFTSDQFETGDDAFYVHIYASTWPASSCSTTYKLKIKS